jgi:tetratricopeptide (TPR) repeat protein
VLWLVHPLNTEAVDYVTQRTELMMGACHLLALYASIRARDAPRTESVSEKGERAPSRPSPRAKGGRNSQVYAHLLLGSELSSAGDHQAALGHLREAVLDVPRAQYALGAELLQTGQWDAALDHLQTFVRQEPLMFESCPPGIRSDGS